MSYREKVGTALKEAYRDLGAQGTGQMIRELIEERKLRPEDLSIREIRESVATDDFSVVTGELISATVIQAFQNADMIGDKLCTVATSKFENDKIAGFEAVEMPEQVLEGSEYIDSGMTDKYVTSQNKKFGRLLSLTEEAVHFDQTREVLARARNIGEKAALHKERRILYGVQDVSSWEAYFPSGVQTALFSSTNGNDVASATFGEAGLVKVLTAIHDQVDEMGDPIYIPRNEAVLLCPIDLWVDVNQMADSTKVPEGMENAVNVFKGMFTPLTSPFVSNQSATTWYYGDPAKAFLWTEVWPLQTFTQKQGSDDLFKRDLAARYKVRYFGNLTCVLPQYWYRATAA